MTRYAYSEGVLCLTHRPNWIVLLHHEYDENGSLVSEKEGSKTASYQYDLLNRQTHVRMPDGKEQENFYDGEGLCAGLKENGKASIFLYLNGEILSECNGDGVPVRRHLSGLGLTCVEDINTGIFHFYHQDEQGSTAYITGNEGTVENSYIYDAFGNVLEEKEDIPNRILYTGQQYDQETGQYYLRTRFYNPVIGRFTQEDTYRGDGLNLYAYCGNNPVMYYDPSGYGCKDNKEECDTTPADYIGQDTDTPDLYHYTTKEGAEAIQSSGVIKPDDRGRVFVTTDQIPSDDVNNALMMGQKPDAGSYVVEITLTDKNDYKLTSQGATQPNELIYNGAIRDGRNATLVVKENNF